MPQSAGQSRTGFLGLLTPEESRDLSDRGRRRHFARGASIVNEGEVPRLVAALLEGTVKVSHFTDDGREAVLGVLGAGDLIGELSAVDGMPTSATVTALEPVDAMVMAPSEFGHYLESHPRVMRLLLVSVTSKLRESDRKRVEFGVHDTEGRIARRLVELAASHGRVVAGGVHITLPLSQQELAGWTGSSREAVSKALRRLRACGWVETHRRGITILALDKLSRRAGM